ncbi:HD domain-containing protein [bacterium]|nr:HD domain-containing protein [bacterium]
MIESSEKTACARAAARAYPDERGHCERVALLAALLFDQLKPLHRLGEPMRELLVCAALLHDIGISVSFNKHHKHSLDLILRAALPALTRREKQIAANVARYHRKALPAMKHSAFRVLQPQDREAVRKLGALIRVADGLDRAHENAVSAISAVQTTPDQWELVISGSGDLDYAADSGMRKRDLFEDVFDVGLSITTKGRHAVAGTRTR